MRRIFLWCFLILVSVAVQPTIAQSDGVFMQSGDQNLLFVSEESILIRITPTFEENVWFSLRTSPGLSLQLDVFAAGGEATDFEVIADDRVRFINFEADESEEYFVSLTPENNIGGYVQVNYDSAQPEAPPITIPSTIVDSTLDPTYMESFEDNSQGWWVGSTENTITNIADGGMRMTLSGVGRTLSAFTGLPGTDQASYYVDAAISIEGDTQGALFSLLLRVEDGVNFSALQIAPNRGAWRFISLNEGIWTSPFGWNSDPRLQGVTGDHTMGVWVLGDVYVLVWDGQPLGHVRDVTHTNGGVGVHAEVSPGGTGTPIFVWDRLTVYQPLDGTIWPRPILPSAAILTPDRSLVFESDDAGRLGLGELVIGEWFWNDQFDTTSMNLTFRPDGSFTRVIAPMRGDAEPSVETGTWRIEGGRTIVVEYANLPTERYTPSLGTNTMTLPELDNRTFIRITLTEE